jgi:hypothetical protein
MSGSARNSSVGGFPLHDTSPAPIRERLQPERAEEEAAALLEEA